MANNPLRRFLVYIVGVVMMSTMLQMFIPTQNAFAAVSAAAVVKIASATVTIGSAIAGNIRPKDSVYLITAANPTNNKTLRFENACEVKGYWPLTSQPIPPDNLSYGVTSQKEFQVVGIYSIETDDKTPKKQYLAFGAYRDQPTISKSKKKILSDVVSSYDCRKYTNINGPLWKDVRDDFFIEKQDVPNTTPPLQTFARHLKSGSFPPATNNVTQYEFTLENK
jgi:hypothetical protein